MTKWRQGRKVGHHVYRQEGDEPTDTDPWVGSFVDPEDAAAAVAAVNWRARLGPPIPYISDEEAQQFADQVNSYKGP